MRRFALPGLLALAGCGDLGTVKLDVEFEDPALALRTRALEVIVREPPAAGDGCDALWVDAPTGLAESRALVEYPSPNDVLATPVKLTLYPRLTFLVYARASTDPAGAPPHAGGCVAATVDGEGNVELTVPMRAR